MSESFEKLRLMPDDQLIKEYDKIAISTSFGAQHYLTELARRDQDRQTKAMLDYTKTMLDSTKTMLGYTKWITYMTVIMTIATIVNVILVMVLTSR